MKMSYYASAFSLCVFALCLASQNASAEGCKTDQEVAKRIKAINESLIPKFLELGKLHNQRIGREKGTPVALDFRLKEPEDGVPGLIDVTIVNATETDYFVGCESESTLKSCNGACPCP